MSTSRSSYNISTAKQNQWLSLRYEEMARSEMNYLLKNLAHVLNFIDSGYYSKKELTQLLNLINETRNIISQRLHQ